MSSTYKVSIFVNFREGKRFDEKYQATKLMGIWAGYSHFFAGDFLNQTGADDDADFAYAQTTFNF